MTLEQTLEDLGKNGLKKESEGTNEERGLVFEIERWTALPESTPQKFSEFLDREFQRPYIHPFLLAANSRLPQPSTSLVVEWIKKFCL